MEWSNNNNNIKFVLDTKDFIFLKIGLKPSEILSCPWFSSFDGLLLSS
jgi:hypothetical protein